MKKSRVTLSQLVLLTVIRRAEVRIGDIEELFDIEFADAARYLRKWRDRSAVKIVAVEEATSKTGPCGIYAPTEKAGAALTIPRDTPLVWPQPGATRRSAATKSAPVLPVGERGLGPEQLPLRSAPRPRSHSGSGQIAGYIQIGRGFRWGAGR